MREENMAGVARHFYDTRWELCSPGDKIAILGVLIKNNTAQQHLKKGPTAELMAERKLLVAELAELIKEEKS